MDSQYNGPSNNEDLPSRAVDASECLHNSILTLQLEVMIMAQLSIILTEAAWSCDL